MSIYQTVKKYVFILSIFFILTTSIHLIVLYLYNGSTLSPEEGGVVNVGFVGDVPSLNPAMHGTDSTNDYLLRFTSRSLLRHNIETHELEGDIANCNLWKNFSEIKCYVKSDNKWSDGTPITKEDILATYSFFKTNEGNKPLKNILENITVEDQGDYIRFSGKADILILDIFLYPIIRSDVIAKLGEGKFSLSSYVSSGPYIFEKRETDDRAGSEKISFVRNVNFSGKSPYIQKYVFHFFQDKGALLKNKDLLNIIFTSEKVDTIPSPRFNQYNYLLPGYISLFLNVEKIPAELRNIILFQLGNTAYKDLDEKAGKIIRNPFFGSESIAPKALENKNILSSIEKLGYYKKESLLTEVFDKTKTTKAKSPLNAFFSAPTNKKQFATGESDVLISGNVPEGVTGVYINDYQLKNFNPSEKKFYFRAKTDIGTLKEGLNTYTLSFVTAGTKIQKEALTIFYSTNKEEVDAKTKAFAEQSASEQARDANEEKKHEQERQSFMTKVSSLDPVYYYNKDLKKFTIHLSFSDQSPYIRPLAENIKASLKLIGIETEFNELGPEDFQKEVIGQGNKSYDMLLTGIDLGLSSYNIFPFFHSGQAEKGFNFSKIKNISLDILLEKLKSSQLNSESLAQIKQSVLDILKKENVVLTFYSPYRAFYIDKHLKDIKNTDILPLPSLIYDLSETAYIKEHRDIDMKSKGIQDFFLWFRDNSPHFLTSLIK